MPIGNGVQLVINVLAVLGAFLAGYILAGLIANLLDRAIFLKKSPRGLHRGARILGGIALALLVAAILFGHGQGWNLFGGGAAGTGDADRGNETQPISTPIVPNVEKPPDVKPDQGETIRVTILGGDEVKAERFYLIDNDQQPKTIAELKAIVLKKKESQSKPPRLIIRFGRFPLPTEHPAVKMLTTWTREVAGLEFSIG